MSDSLFEVRFSQAGVQGNYRTDVRSQDPNGNLRLLPGIEVRLDLPGLETLRVTGTDEEYTTELTRELFADDRLKYEFQNTCNLADTIKSHVRFRLILSPEVPDLHNIRWEMLGEKQGSGLIRPMNANRKRLFSRFLPPPAKPVRMASARLRAVVLIANPRTWNGVPIGEIKLKEQSAAVELLRTQTDCTVLTGKRANSTTLTEELRRGADLLYVVCHGYLHDGVPWLLFESDDGEAEGVDSRLLADRIAGADVLPPLLFAFGSCDSAGSGQGSNGQGSNGWDAGVLSSVGARMCDAGVQAVVGMQGMVAQKTNADFFVHFFSELMETGNVERAFSAGRVAVTGMEDWWMPLLLLTRESGQLWDERSRRRPFNWTSILAAIDDGTCTPILGSELLSPLSNRRFAQVLIDEADDEAAHASSDELAWVAQHYKVSHNLATVTDRFNDFVRDQFVKDKTPAIRGERLQERLNRWGESAAAHPHLGAIRRLAALPFTYYVSTNPDNLLEQELRKKKVLVPDSRHGTINERLCTPMRQVCPWNGDVSVLHSANEFAGVEASEEKPLVYHLFGSLMGNDQSRTTTVLTEDDFFAHLIWISKNSSALSIRYPLTAHTLLFLGFHLRDWEFRILLQCIKQLEGNAANQSLTHVAVQIPESDPEEREQAERDLKTFFRNSRIRLEICFGTVEEFTSDLLREWQRRMPAGGENDA